MKQIAIIGGGAAGLMAAVSAAQELRRAGAVQAAEVVVYEADPERVGRSILATGNGRCNWSNARISPDVYHNADFVARVFEQAKPSAVHGQFERLGLVWREEAQGRMYPFANKASSVLDVLRGALTNLGVRCEFDKKALRVEANAGRWHIRFLGGAVAHADALVIAPGGRAIGLMELPQPLTCMPVKPVLGPLEVVPDHKKLTRQLNNIRVRCRVALKRAGKVLASESGELLFRDYGVSGVCVFNLSRFAQPGDAIVINFIDGATGGNKDWLAGRFQHLSASCAGAPLNYESLLCGLLLPQVGQVLLSELGFKPSDECTAEGVGMLACMLQKFKLQVKGVGDARQCQVARGGLSVAQFALETLQARGLPGLFAAGEALDVDAPCGGFNLHWAWASGMVAGASAARTCCG